VNAIENSNDDITRIANSVRRLVERIELLTEISDDDNDTNTASPACLVLSRNGTDNFGGASCSGTNYVLTNNWQLFSIPVTGAVTGQIKDFFKATMNYSDATKALVTEKTLEFEIRLKSSTAIYKEALRLKIPSDDLMILVSTSIKFDIPIETIDKLYKNIKSQNLPYNENAARLTSVIAEKHQTKFKAGSSISQTEFSKTINLYREILYSLYLRADLERYPEIAPQLLQICLKFNLTSDVLLYTFILRYKLYNSDFSYTFPPLLSLFFLF
jgi:hypothetical protein